MEALTEMEPPKTGQKLQQFPFTMQWVKAGIPNFAALISPLHDFLQRVYSAITSRKKTAVSRLSLQVIGSGEKQEKAFNDCKRALAEQVTLDHRDHKKRLSSDEVRSGVIMQVPIEDVEKPHSEKRHEPLAFLSCRFDSTQLLWSIL